MIYTVTLNPAIDYIIQADEIIMGATNRANSEYYHIGGKGINVSIVLSNLLIPSTCLGFIGGFTGSYLKEQLKTYENISQQFIQTHENTRVNVKVKGKEETEINGNGPHIDALLLEQLEKQLSAVTSDDFVMLSGSMAPNMPEDWYTQITKQLHEREIPFAVDIASKQLLDLVEYGPLFIKPNEAELAELFDKERLSKDEIIFYAQELVSRGAQHVIVSCGSEGSLLVSEHEVLEATVAEGTLVDSVGAGDSLVAGFIYGYHILQADAKEALRFASSSGSATAYSVDLATKEKIEEVYQNTSIKEI